MTSTQRSLKKEIHNQETKPECLDFLQPWRSALSRTGGSDRTSMRWWAQACGTCWTGLASLTQVPASCEHCLKLWLVLQRCPLLMTGAVFEGGWVDVFTLVKNIDYPRDSKTHNITAAIHSHLQVCPCRNVRIQISSLEVDKLTSSPQTQATIFFKLHFF